MDTPELEPKLLTAGQEFSDALDALGFDTSAVFWGFDKEIEQHVLILITDFLDYQGPLKISKLLFKAYNASALPQAIDLFIVRLHSADQQVGRSFLTYAGSGFTFRKIDKYTGKPIGERFEYESADVQGVIIQKEWVIKAQASKARKPVELSRRWKRFEQNVEHRSAA